MPGCEGRHGGSRRGAHRVGCWGAASGLSSARKLLLGGLGDPLEPPWSPELGAWLLPSAMVGAWELEQIIQPRHHPSQQAALHQGHPCLHSTVPGRQRRRAESRGEDAAGWSLAAPRHPAGTQPGRWGPHEKPLPTASPKPPAAAGPKAPSRGLGAAVLRPAWFYSPGKDVWVGCVAVAQAPCSGWLPEQCAAMLLFSGSVRVIEF